MGHIQLARTADLVWGVPATASFMARANAGTDDLATTILLATKQKWSWPSHESYHVDTSSNKK